MVKFSAQNSRYWNACNGEDDCHSAGDTGKLRKEVETTVATMEQLEAKVDELIELCAILGRENRALRAQQQNWSAERAKLIEKNELAKSRVESMITRLKTLEQD